MITPVRRINMISDMTVIKYVSAFSASETNTAHFPAFQMRNDFPGLLMSESQSRFGLKHMNRNQVNDAVGKLSAKSVKKQSLHFLYSHLFKQALKIRTNDQLRTFGHDAGSAGGNAVTERFFHASFRFISGKHTADHGISGSDG